jgi:hypothetical protein
VIFSLMFSSPGYSYYFPYEITDYCKN